MGTVRLDGQVPAELAVGQDLLGALLDAGVPVLYLCMAGSCGRCRVQVQSGLHLLTPPNPAEQHHRCGGPDRLACQARLASDGDLHIHQ